MSLPTIGILGGTGKMGEYFAEFFRERGHHVLIAGRKTPLTKEKLIQKSDVVIVSVPIAETVKMIKAIAPLLRDDQLFMDLASLKAESVKAMLKSKAAVIGLHPMFGPTNKIAGQTVIACPARPKDWWPWVEKIFTKAGATLRKLDAQEHDELMAVIQGLTHFSNLALVTTLADSKIPFQKFFDHNSPAYRLKMFLAGRMLAQNPELYGQLEMENPQVPKVLKAYLKTAEALAQIIQKKKLAEYTKVFNNAANYLKNFTAEAQQKTDMLIENLSTEIAESTRIPLQLPKEKIENSLGVLGPKYTHSDAGADAYLNKENLQRKKIYFPTITSALEAVAQKLVDESIVPLENKIEGVVRETIDAIFRANLFVHREIKIPIHHVLAVTPATDPKKITVVYSHPQILAQCRNFLQKNFPKATTVATVSSSAAMEKVSQQKDAAAIGTFRAAAALHLKVLHKDVEDDNKNETKFAVVKKTFTPEKDHDRVSIAFYFTKNRPGVLAEIFNEFAKKELDLTGIRSRPAEKKFGEYVFFLDFRGNLEDKNVQKILETLKKKTAELKVLGAFRAA